MTNQEPRYKREVFEGLLNTLDVVLTEESAIHMPDDAVRGNYDIRDDGVWLRRNDTVPAFNWTPVCDMEEGPESPDPLTTPALPFPFTARHLAAFIVGGWGLSLGQRFADESGKLDTEIVLRLLHGSPDHTKLRESITEAFKALQNARLNAPTPDPQLEQELVKTQDECEAAESAAAAAHDWRDISQQEAVREKRRLAYLAAVNPYRKKKREAQVSYDEAQETWRKGMVRQLLLPQKDAGSAPQAAPTSNTSELVADRTSETPAKPMQRSAAQDAAILSAIRDAGHNPLALPVNEPGKPGVKAAIRETLKCGGLFVGATVFDKAWERLRKQGDIADTA